MKKIISTLSIENFKSIQKLEFDCNKINVFIGEPNVGKSNILEALSMFQFADLYSMDLFTGGEVKDFILNNILRFQQPENLFHYQNTNSPIKIDTNKDTIHFNSKKSKSSLSHLQNKERYNVERINTFKLSLDENFKLVNHSTSANAHEDPKLYKKYDFNKNFFATQKNNSNSLSFPYGENAISILAQNPKVLEILSDIFEKTGFQFVIDENTNTLTIQRKITKTSVRSIPFQQVADTIHRMIFYLCAVYSNKNSILIFEEPEVHSFPPYVASLAQEIIKSETNQFFIATHSPYLLNEIIEKTPKDDVNIFVTYLKDFQTYVRLLTQEELSELLDYGVDIFFNIDKYIGE